MEYEYVKKLYYDSVYDIENISQNIYLILLNVISFFLPFVLGHPQILVGVIVNAMLIIGATYLKGHKLLPLILLPSIGVLTAGVLFGTYTVFLLYLIPLIWIGNAVYVYIYKHFTLTKNTMKNSLIGVGVASIVKAAILLGVTFILVKLFVLPTIFLTAMGILQIVTALIGGVLAIGLVAVREKVLN